MAENNTNIAGTLEGQVAAAGEGCATGEGRAASGEQTGAASGAVKVISVGGAGSLFGLGGVINVLLLAAAWGVVGIGYICVPGSLVAAVLGVVCAAMNLASGVAPALLCLGVAVSCAGLCYPVFVGARLLQNVLLKREAKVELRKNVLAVSLIIVVVGAAAAGLAALLGASDALMLPAFLQAIFEN